MFGICGLQGSWSYCFCSVLGQFQIFYSMYIICFEYLGLGGILYVYVLFLEFECQCFQKGRLRVEGDVIYS